MADNISREIKSSLFIDYFGIDEVVGKQNFLELYNAIQDTHLLKYSSWSCKISYWNLPFVRKCDKIREYSNFINYVYDNANMQDPDSCKEVIQQANQKGFLPNYLERKITEVENMLCAKYDYDLDIQVKQEEAFANGISKGISQERIETAKRMLERQIDVNIISIATKMSVEEILKLKN